MTSTALPHLIEQFHQGTPGAAEVLRDWYLEYGVDAETATNCINALSIGTPGPAPVGIPLYEIKPYAFYDTVRIGRPAGSRREFFRELAGNGFDAVRPGYKTEADTNFNQPQRIGSYNAFRVQRITLRTLEGNLNEFTTVYIKVGIHTILETSAADLAARGIWGAPALRDISDRDDLRGHIVTGIPSTEQVLVRVTLHGWLKSGIN